MNREWSDKNKLAQSTPKDKLKNIDMQILFTFSVFVL